MARKSSSRGPRVGQKVKYKSGRGFAIGKIAAPPVEGKVLIESASGRQITRKVEGLLDPNDDAEEAPAPALVKDETQAEEPALELVKEE
jgi:hypothetical protein